jgi:hypothetical protein
VDVALSPPACLHRLYGASTVARRPDHAGVAPSHGVTEDSGGGALFTPTFGPLIRPSSNAFASAIAAFEALQAALASGSAVLKGPVLTPPSSSGVPTGEGSWSASLEMVSFRVALAALKPAKP